MLLDAMKRRSDLAPRTKQAKLAPRVPKMAWAAPAAPNKEVPSPTFSEKIARIDFRPTTIARCEPLSSVSTPSDVEYDMIHDLHDQPTEDLSASILSEHAVSKEEMQNLMETLDRSIFESAIQVQADAAAPPVNDEDEYKAMIQAGLALISDAKAAQREVLHATQASHALQIDLLQTLMQQQQQQAADAANETMAFDAKKYPILMDIAKQRLFVLEKEGSQTHLIVNPTAQAKLLKYWNDHFDEETLLAMLDVAGVFESIYNHTLQHVILQHQ